MTRALASWRPQTALDHAGPALRARRERIRRARPRHGAGAEPERARRRLGEEVTLAGQRRGARRRRAGEVEHVPRRLR